MNNKDPPKDTYTAEVKLKKYVQLTGRNLKEMEYENYI